MVWNWLPSKPGCPQVGVPHIDHQHSELIRLFQHLQSVDANEEAITDMLYHLTRLIHEQFESEESFMAGLDTLVAEMLEHVEVRSQIIENLTDIHLATMLGVCISFREIAKQVAGYLLKQVMTNQSFRQRFWQERARLNPFWPHSSNWGHFLSFTHSTLRAFFFWCRAIPNLELAFTADQRSGSTDHQRILWPGRIAPERGDRCVAGAGRSGALSHQGKWPELRDRRLVSRRRARRLDRLNSGPIAWSYWTATSYRSPVETIFDSCLSLKKTPYGLSAIRPPLVGLRTDNAGLDPCHYCRGHDLSAPPSGAPDA